MIDAVHTACKDTTAGLFSLLLRHEETIRRVLILAVLYLIPALCILQPVLFDPDVWWQLQAGKWIVDHGAIPSTDPFSSYGEGKPWVAYSWLFEIGIYGLLRQFGESGVILYALVTTWAIVALLHRIVAKRVEDFGAACALVAASVLSLEKLFTPRPWLLTILFFATTLEVVLALREDRGSQWVWGLPLIYVIWANIHVQFIYGLGLLGLACAAPILDRVLQPISAWRSPMVWGGRRWRQLVTIAALCGCATLLTPHHIRLYSVIVELAAQTGMWEYAFEMLAPSFRLLSDWTLLALLGAALFHLGRQSTHSSFEVILLIIASASAFRGQRDSWLLVMAVVAVFLSPQATGGRRATALVPRRRSLLAASVLILIGTLGILSYRDFSERTIQENTAKLYPIAAASFVEQKGLQGPLYNHFNWGGYLIWRLPELKVSMDGRANVHGDARIKQSIKTWSGESHWSEDLELDGAGVVIAQKDMPLSSLLRLDARFQLTYQDETAVVFVRVRDGKE